MPFYKYQHIERLGHLEVADILDDRVTIYPKLDGTNASLWWEGMNLHAGSRNRHLTPEADNAGFLKWAREHKGLVEFLVLHEDTRLFGEWLVPHSLRTYREDAWRRFWVFDVKVGTELVPAESFAEVFDALEIDYIAPLANILHPTEEQLQGLMTNTNTFLIEDGAGVGEGIVIKRYGAWRNKFGHQKWAKMVRNEFKDLNRKTFSVRETQGAKQVEAEIVNEFVTDALVKKELAKIVHDIAGGNHPGGNSSEILEYYNTVMMSNRGQVIPRLLQTVYYCLIKEEMWAILKRHKNAKIDFGKLSRLTVVATKRFAPELF